MPIEIRQRCAALVALSGTLGIAILSLVPIQFRPHLLAVGQFEHFACYFATAVAFALAWKDRRTLILVLASLSLLAAAMEIGQFWVPGRTPRISDWLAGSLGAMAGMAFVVGLSWAAGAINRSVMR